MGCLALLQPALAAEGRWSEQRAHGWYERQPWLTGCNFSPSTAINQLEMWQADTFDMATIDRELGWAEGLGFNCARVFLHDLVWKQDAPGFFQRMEQFLAAADRHKIKVMFVIFDSCWDPFPKSGKQHEPKPHVHNSGWVQSPGLEILTKLERHDELQPYVTDVIRRFKNDPRILAWDLFNEPDNTNGSSYSKYEPANKGDIAFALLKKTFTWARAAEPSQPLTAGVWSGEWAPDGQVSPINKFMLENSDVISFHNYGPLQDMRGASELAEEIQSAIDLHRVHGTSGGKHVPGGHAVYEGAEGWRDQLGLCGREDPDDLSMGFMEKDLHSGAAALVPRYLSQGRCHVRSERGDADSNVNREDNGEKFWIINSVIPTTFIL